MMVLTRSFFYCLLLITYCVLVFSCHPAKKITSATTAVAGKDTAFVNALETYKKNAPQFSALTIKGDVEYTSGNEIISFNMHMRIRKDSAIWISASPFLGIEMMRMLITPDSVKILDKWNNIYYSDNIEALQISFHAGMNMDVLQSLICASYITSSINDTLRSLYLENPDYVLSTVEKKKEIRSDEQTSELPFACDLWCTNPTMRVNKMVLSEPKSARQLEAKYEDYRHSDAGVFPYLTTITAKDEATQKTAFLRVTVGKIISSGEVEMPFTVPKKFEHRRLVRER
jgi:hypothetical protein